MSNTATIGTGTLLLRACRAEWLRLWSVRSTWGLTCLTAFAMVGIGVMSTSGEAPDPGDPAWIAAAYGTIPGQIALVAIALAAVTADHTTGGIGLALQWTPRRSLFFAARAIVAVLTVTTLGCALGLAATMTAYLTGPPALDLPLGRGLEILGAVALVLASGSALAVGLGFLVRNTATGIVVLLLLLLVLPGLVPQLATSWAETVADLLPGSNALFLLVGEPDDRGISTTSAIATLVAWGAGGLGAGWVRVARSGA